MIKAFISHSSKQKDFALKLVDSLGKDLCLIDCYNFESAYKTLDEIFKSIEKSTIFVLLISRDSLDSDWVKKEIAYARNKLSANDYNRFWPFIIDETITIDDCPEWMRRDECFNLKLFKSPYMLARDIEQKFRKIVWADNERIKQEETIMVGRNDDVGTFEDIYLSAAGTKIRAMVISGRAGVGKEVFAKQCMYKIGYPLEQEPYRISMDVKKNVEDFIIALNMFTATFDGDALRTVLKESPKEKSKTAVKLLNELLDSRSILFVEDNMSCILPNRDIPEWLADVLADANLSKQLGIFFMSRIIPNSFFNVTHPQIANITLQPLDKADRQKLFYRYLRIYCIQCCSEEDVAFFVDRLLLSPEQIKRAVKAIKNHSLTFAKKDIDALVRMGDNTIRSLFDRYKDDEQRHLLTIMSRFDFISYEILEDIFEERIKDVLETIYDMMTFGIITAFGPSERFFRLDHYISDYITRNHFQLPKDLAMHVSDVLQERIAGSNDITEDTSLYLYDVKERIVSGNDVEEGNLIPSIVIRSIMDVYNKQDYKLVISICDKALGNPHPYYKDVVLEITYWLCLALCRIQSKERFLKEVRAIKGVEYFFLQGFYSRIAGDYKAAERQLQKALDRSPGMRRAKREMVTVLLSQNRFGEALSLAKENYEGEPENSYHIYAYFRCLVRNVAKDRSSITTLDNLRKAIEQSFSDKREQLMTAMNIDYNVYVMSKRPEEIFALINEAEKNFPESQEVHRAAQDYRKKQGL